MNYSKQGVRKKQRALNSKSIRWQRKILLSIVKLSLLCVIGVGIWGICLGLGAFRGILEDTPVIRLSDVVANGQATIVYDCMGNELDQYVSQNSNRIEVSAEEIPDHLGKAFVALEDERFYQHNGIDFKAMFRAAYTFIESGFDTTQGASTITQQLLKNTIFTTWTSEGNNFVKKIKRKIQEQYLALEITKNFTKDEILVRYMNAINLGQNTLGVEAASQRYFGKSVSELTISESAVIAGITQNPSALNPISHPENNMKRRQKCLNSMERLGFITKAQYDEAMADTEAVYERIGLYDTSLKEGDSTSGSYFSDAVYEQVKKDLVNIAGYSQSMAETLLTAGGLRIESTMDPVIQKIANEEFANPANYPENVKWYLTYALTVYDLDDNPHNYSKENMTTYYKKNIDKDFNLIFSSQEAAYDAINLYRSVILSQLDLPEDYTEYDEAISLTPQPQAAIAIQDQQTGYVLALVGGRGNKEGRRTLNRATSAMRSPGSTFKVLASFAPALDCAGLTLASVYDDKPFNYDGGTPVNNWYNNTAVPYRGIQSIRQAIQDSLNVIAVKNQTVITPQLGFDYLVNFGFTTLEEGGIYNGEFKTDIVQPIALGGLTRGVTPLEVNAAYASIANGGLYLEPKLYSRVTDADGNVILDNSTQLKRQVLKESTAFLLTDAMQDVVKAGTGTACRFDKNMGIAGKTGSSTDYKDVWFAGFTPYYTCTTWAGYDNSIGMSSDRNNRETGIAQNLWASIMKRVHEELPAEQFTVPANVVQAEICTRSGKLPFPGLCDVAGCVRTEYFAEGTIPTDICDVHYQGEICAYDHLPASYDCPFKYMGTMEVPLIEHSSLLPGSTMITDNPDGTQTIIVPNTATHCQHDAAFFLDPNSYNILYQQQIEMQIRAEAAAAAAAAGQ